MSRRVRHSNALSHLTTYAKVCQKTLVHKKCLLLVLVVLNTLAVDMQQVGARMLLLVSQLGRSGGDRVCSCFSCFVYLSHQPILFFPSSIHLSLSTHNMSGARKVAPAVQSLLFRYLLSEV